MALDEKLRDPLSDHNSSQDRRECVFKKCLYIKTLHCTKARSVGYSICATWMFVPDFVQLVDIEVFHRRSENFGQLVALDENTGIQKYKILSTKNNSNIQNSISIVWSNLLDCSLLRRFRLHSAVQAKQKDKQTISQLEKRLKAEQEARVLAEKQLAEERKRKKMEEATAARAVALAAATRY